MTRRDVRCSGCGRRLGTSPNRLPGFIFCPDPSLLCDHLPPAGANAERDALIVEVAQRWPALRVGKAFDVSRQRVQQILAARRGE